MTGTELHCQQKAHAPITALEKALPGSFLLFMLWFQPVGVCLQPRSWRKSSHSSEQPKLPVDLDSPPRNLAIPWKSLLGVQSTGRRKQQKSTCGSFFQKTFFREREQASPHTLQAFTHLHCSEFRGHLPLHNQPRVTCKRHLPSSLFRQRASQCRSVLPRATVPEKKKLSSFRRAARAGQEEPGEAFPAQPQHPPLHCSRAQHPPRPATAGAVLLHLPQERHTLHAPEHHRAGPQSLPLPWGTYRATLPTRQPSSTTDTS